MGREETVFNSGSNVSGNVEGNELETSAISNEITFPDFYRGIYKEEKVNI